MIDAEVEMGPDCWVGAHAYITGRTRIGAHNQFFAGCVIGEAPQDLKYDGAPTGLEIGDYNRFRENVTVNRSTSPAEPTKVGSHNLLMAGSHVAHNCAVGNRVIIANGALLGGHVLVQDRALISGNCLVHQFVRVGTLAMMQGGSAISKDLPPYTVARGDNGICGLNIEGLRRASFSQAERLELKQLYHLLFRGGLNLREAMEAGRKKFSSPSTQALLDFLAGAKRGVCADLSRKRAGTGTEEDSE